MAKKNNGAKVEQAVVTTDVVVDTVSTPTVEVTAMTDAPISKAQQALAIFTTEAAAGDDKLRARVIARFKAELGMGPAGASTYFQNVKKIAAGGKVKHYYKPASERKTTTDPVDDSQEEADVFESELADGSIKCFLSQAEKEEFDAANAELLKPLAE